MKTIEINLYEFNELSQQAKDKVRNCIYLGLDYLNDDIQKSFDAFCDLFDVNWRSIDYQEPYRNEYKINVPEYAEDLKGVRLATYLYNNYLKNLYKGKFFSTNGYYIDGKYHYKFKYSNWYKEISCPFSGCCYDEFLLDAIIKFCDKPNDNDTFESLIDECIMDLCKAVQAEIEYRLTDEAIKEDCEANQYFFTESGEIA